MCIALASCSKKDSIENGVLTSSNPDSSHLLDTGGCTIMEVDVSVVKGCCDSINLITIQNSDTLFTEVLTLEEITHFTVPKDSELQVDLEILLGPCLCIEASEYNYSISFTK